MPITVGTSSITFNDSTTQNTAGITSAVTSAVAGNGIGVSGATGAVTFSAACPTFNTVGSYSGTQFVSFGPGGTGSTPTAGSNYSVGVNDNQVLAGFCFWNTNACPFPAWEVATSASLSGTWKWMGATGGGGQQSKTMYGICCRVA